MDVDRFLDQAWPHVLQQFTSTVTGDLGKATANLGERLLAKVIRRRGDDQPDQELATAAHDVKANPEDADFENALRGKLKKALRDANPYLLAEFAAELAASPSPSGERSVTASTVVRSTVITGDNNHIR